MADLGHLLSKEARERRGRALIMMRLEETRNGQRLSSENTLDEKMAENKERGGRTVHDPLGHPTYIIAKQASQVNRQENMGNLKLGIGKEFSGPNCFSYRRSDWHERHISFVNVLWYMGRETPVIPLISALHMGGILKCLVL